MTDKPSLITLWLLRGLLAVLLLFSAEVLLWSNRAALDLLPAVVGYLALGALVLDLAARYRIRDLYDTMALLALYGLCVGLLLHPELVLADFPRTLITRVMGGFTALGMYLFGAWLALTGGGPALHRRLLMGFAVWLGFYWGIWLRWSPALTGLFPPVNPLDALSVAGAVLAVTLLLLLVLRTRGDRSRLTLEALVLSPVELALVLLALGVLLLVRLLLDQISSAALVVFAILGTLSWSVLWFRRANRGRTLLDGHMPPRLLPLHWAAAAVGTFAAAFGVGWVLPLTWIAGYNQLSVMEFAFFAVGVAWLPFIAVVLALRAFDRIVKTGKLW